MRRYSQESEEADWPMAQMQHAFNRHAMLINYFFLYRLMSNPKNELRTVNT